VKALLLTAPGVLEYVDVPEPEVGDDEVLVRVEAVGICGSDVHGMDGSSGRRVPPLVMGHEAAGVVEALGGSVAGFAPGDAVTFDSTIWCGRCAFCRDGVVNLCDDRRVLGVSTGEYRRDGAFAERVVVPARVVYALPAGVSMVEAALTEPLAVALHAVSRTPLVEDDEALVVGCGVIGLLVIAAVRQAGCKRIIAVDLSPSRLARATAMGATDVVTAGSDDVVEQLQALTDGRGPDVAFEAVGIGSTVALAIAAVRKGGTVVLVGNVVPAVELPLQWVVSRQLTLLGSAASCGEYPRALELIASRAVDVAALVSEVAPLADGAEWFDRLRAPQTPLLKVVLEP
jgi:L-iditol 2-dehydrogenase